MARIIVLASGGTSIGHNPDDIGGCLLSAVPSVRFFRTYKVPLIRPQDDSQRLERRKLQLVALRLAYVLRPRNCSIFLSVLYWLRAYTAQMVAGIQPISVIWRIRQITPAIGLPMVKNVSHGSIRASSKRIDQTPILLWVVVPNLRIRSLTSGTMIVQ